MASNYAFSGIVCFRAILGENLLHLQCHESCNTSITIGVYITTNGMMKMEMVFVNFNGSISFTRIQNWMKIFQKEKSVVQSTEITLINFALAVRGRYIFSCTL